MSPLGQFPNFLTDGSRIRRPPVDDTKNPIFRLARRTSKDFRFTIHNLFFPDTGRSPASSNYFLTCRRHVSSRTIS